MKKKKRAVENTLLEDLIFVAVDSIIIVSVIAIILCVFLW